MSVFEKVFKTPYEQRYMNIALPAAIECVFMNVLASADLIMVGSLGATFLLQRLKPRIREYMEALGRQ